MEIIITIETKITTQKVEIAPKIQQLLIKTLTLKIRPIIKKWTSSISHKKILKLIKIPYKTTKIRLITQKKDLNLITKDPKIT